MKFVQLSLRLFQDGNKAMPNQSVLFQWFMVSRGIWVQFSNRKTNAQGTVSVRLSAAVFGEAKGAPMLRAVLPGNPSPLVISSGPMLRFDARNQILFADFGHIELLGDATYKRLHQDSGQARAPDRIAGVPRKAEVSQAILMHNINADATLRAEVAVSRQPAGSIRVNTGEAVLSRSTATVSAPVAAVPASREVETLRAILHEKDASLSKATLNTVKVDAELNNTKAELRNKVELLKVAEQRVTEAETRAATAEGKVATVTATAGKEASVHDVLSGLGTKLADANADLSKKKLPFRLGKIKVDLRGDFVGDTGKMILGKDDHSGSGLSTEFHIDDATSHSATTVKVPDVAGLTENAARRVLRSVGLRLSASQQPIKAGQGTPGQARTQHPAAGQNAEHGSEVLVVFGVLNEG